MRHSHSPSHLPVTIEKGLAKEIVASRRTDKYEEPASPLKKSRVLERRPRTWHLNQGPSSQGTLDGRWCATATCSIKNANTSKTRRRASSSDHDRNHDRGREGEKRERKKHKVHRHNGTASGNIRHERRRGSDASPEAQRRKLKAIEYRKHSESGY